MVAKKKSAAKPAAQKAAPKKPAAAPSTAKSLLGKAAPAFAMPATDGTTVTLAGLRGRRVLLYFYPKDDTPGCTAEACAFRDGAKEFTSAKTVVIGVSKDSLAKHQKFKTKYQLNFLLASDETSGVCEKYGVWMEKSMYGRKYMGIERSTFLIDEKGIVRAEWRKVSVPTHYDEVKAALKAL